MERLIHIVYVSFSNKPLSEQEILDLLTEIREKNRKKMVTGLLLYNNQAFIQVIEGTEHSINSLFNNIKKDPRHGNIVKLLEEEIDARAFPDWSMGFSMISKKESDEIPGFSDFMHAENPEEILQNSKKEVVYLLNKFKMYT
jgi:hypothetical protein